MSQADQFARPGGAATLAPEPAPLSRPILVIEDNDDDLVLLKRLFGQANVKVPLEIAFSGHEAIRRFSLMPATALPRLIVTDLAMPDGDGFEVLAWAREQAGLKDTLRVVLSSTRRGVDIDRCYALGASFFLSKFPSAAMIARLCDAAEKRDAETLSKLKALQRPRELV